MRKTGLQDLGGQDWADFIADLFRSARSEIMIVGSGTPVPFCPYRSGVVAAKSHLADGRRVHCLLSQECFGLLTHRNLLHWVALGMQVRVSNSHLSNLLIVDRSVAVAWDPGRDDGTYRATVYRDVRHVRPLVELTRAGWDSAQRLTLSDTRIIDGLVGDRWRQIIAALETGMTDEVAARSMSISVRTYRRHVAELLEKVGASSRFQAGSRLASLRMQTPRSHDLRKVSAAHAREGEPRAAAPRHDSPASAVWGTGVRR
ncbi:hypothetical protein HII36_03765 [Nonomuraea sp. NN258]|uniref:helix-turn-helix transcriptional regulator n=1 Tax=Nonomuraea antri TaxID=2730852 RepID=UPI001568E375|nr:hypothetical protein [Nonomuraea antri]NRQ30950.1 hypothetical protein [Nonomuraea antri]